MKEIEKLVRISTYASLNRVSVTWIYKLIARGDLICVEIDGVKFVKI